MAARSYRLGVDVGLGWALTALLSAFAGIWLVVAWSSRDVVNPGMWTAIGALVAVAAVVGFQAPRTALDDRETLAVGLVAVGLQVAWRFSPALHITPGQRCMVTTATAFAALAFASRRWGGVALTSALVAQVLTDTTVDGPLAATAGLWPVLAAAIASGVCVPALRSAAARADDAAAEQRAAAVDEATSTAERDAQRRLQGVLHDQIVSALRAISSAGVTETEARFAAESAADAIGRVPWADDEDAPEDLARDVRETVAASGVVTSGGVVSTSSEEELQVPGRVAAATAAALAEVLRNIERHARAQRVRVTLERDGDGFALTTTDDGVGFRAATGAVASHGLRHSVIRRMESAGGSAHVTSVPGQGTTVRLSWRPAPTPPPALVPSRAERIAAALVDVRAPLAAVVAPYLVMTAVLAVAFSVNGRVTGWLLVWFAGLAVLTLLLLGRAHTGLSGPVVVWVFAYGLAGTIASARVLPVDSLEDYSSWPLGATTSLLAIMAVVRPVREAVAALLVQQTAIVVAMLAGGLGGGSWSDQIARIAPAALSSVTPVVLGMILSQAVLQLGDAVTRANHERSLIAAKASARGARTRLHARRLSELGAEVLPFLRAIADGTTDPNDPTVRQAARALEHAARDELHLPGVLTPETREALHRARTAGCTVRILNGAAEPIADGEVICRLLVTALGVGAVPRELVLTMDPSRQAPVSLVTTPGDDGRAEALRREFGSDLLVLEATTDVTWAEVATS